MTKYKQSKEEQKMAKELSRDLAGIFSDRDVLSSLRSVGERRNRRIKERKAL